MGLPPPLQLLELAPGGLPPPLWLLGEVEGEEGEAVPPTLQLLEGGEGQARPVR